MIIGFPYQLFRFLFPLYFLAFFEGLHQLFYIRLLIPGRFHLILQLLLFVFVLVLQCQNLLLLLKTVYFLQIRVFLPFQVLLFLHPGQQLLALPDLQLLVPLVVQRYRSLRRMNFRPNHRLRLRSNRRLNRRRLLIEPVLVERVFVLHCLKNSLSAFEQYLSYCFHQFLSHLLH